MMSIDIPTKDRPEWAEMAQGQHAMKKYVLQLQIDRISKKMAANEMTVDEGVEYLYEYFCKYPKGFRRDLEEIFKSW
ncbi:hypothetical protein [Endozoicomonas sp.]|uniref:hypothetical protein n=1 Tax=Endozoicomonas sp. TaxID=1892382 RepID=UPI0028869685|nr:hypothetical protein [Endozoicomonas sp.]